MNRAASKNNLFYRIVKLVRDQDSISRAGIANRLDKNPTTIGRAVDVLISKNIMLHTGEKITGGIGRPPELLKFNAQFGSILSVDLRLTEVYAVVTDLAGKILATKKQPLSSDRPEKSINQLVETIRTLLQTTTELPPVYVIVVGAPSTVSTAGVIEWAPSLGWKNVPLKRVLEEKFGVTTLVKNDVNLAALGEFWIGAGQKSKQNMLFISVGTGIGAGIIINGELYQGATNAAGEVAYFITDVNILREDGGEIGYLENQIGRDGIIRSSQLVARRYPTSKLAELLSQSGMHVKTRKIFSLAENGDIAAEIVYRNVIDILTIIICNSSVMLDPEIIVLGGPSAWNWPTMIKAIKDRIGTNLLRPVHLMPSELGKNALILGGTYSALKWLPLFK